MNKKILLSLVFFAVFGLGVMTGLGMSTRFGPAAVEKRALHINARERWKRLAEQLQLTEEQRERIKPLVYEATRRQRENLAEIKKELRVLEEKIRAELTPEQRARFRELRREDRGGRYRPEAPPPPGPSGGPATEPSPPAL
jgi:Spy/CpxP family protein refolding chaperone